MGNSVFKKDLYRRYGEKGESLKKDYSAIPSLSLFVRSEKLKRAKMFSLKCIIV